MLDQATKKHILHISLLFLLLISYAPTLQAAAAEAQPNTQESYDYTLQTAPGKVSHITQAAYLDTEEMPQELDLIIKNMPTQAQPHTKPAQLLAIVAHHPTTQHYCKYLFASNGLLAGHAAQKKAHQLNYHLVKSPPSPVIWQVLSFLHQKPKLMVKQCILPKESPLCLQCGRISMHLFDQHLLMKKGGCQGETWPNARLSAGAIKTFNSQRFGDQKRQMTIAAVGDIFTKKASCKPDMSNNDTQKAPLQPIQSATTQTQLHALVQSQLPLTIIKAMLDIPQTNINALDTHGKTPLDYASQGSDIYQLLVGYDAKTSTQLKQQPATILPPLVKEIQDIPIYNSDQDGKDDYNSDEDGKDDYKEEHKAEKAPSIPSQQAKNNAPAPYITHYQNRYSQLPGLLDDLPQPIESCYVQLQLQREVQGAAQDKALKNDYEAKESEEKEAKAPDKKEEPYQPSLDHLHHTKTYTPIKLVDLWKDDATLAALYKESKEDKKPLSTQPPHHILITGKAGMGKTTLTQRIIYQWTKGALWQDRFQWMLLIPLREISSLPHTLSPTKATKAWYSTLAKKLALPSIDGPTLQQWLTTQAQAGLLILDGYDEIASIAAKKSHPLAQWLAMITQQPQLSILLTSHPHTTCPYLQQPRQLEVTGFTDQDSTRYINQYFQQKKQPALAKALLGQLTSPALHPFRPVPLYIRLLCFLSTKNDPKTIAQWTLAKLYKTLIQHFFCYALAKQTGKRCAPADIFRFSPMEIAFFAKLAWLGLAKSQQSLSIALQEEALDHCIAQYPRPNLNTPPHWHRIRSIGLLAGGGPQAYKATAPSQPAYFPHYTFQEWWAAYYLAESSHYPKAHPRHRLLRQVLTIDRYTPRYQLMLPFLAGIHYQRHLHEQDPTGSGLVYFWKLLSASPRALADIHHTTLMMRCLAACKADTSPTLAPEVIQQHQTMLNYTAQWLKTWLNNHDHIERDSWGDLIKKDYIGDHLKGVLPSCTALLLHPVISKMLVQVLGRWLAQEGRDVSLNRIAALSILGSALGTAKVAEKVGQWLLPQLAHQNQYVRGAVWEEGLPTLAQYCPKVLAKEAATILQAWQQAILDQDQYVRQVAWAYGLKALAQYCPKLVGKEAATILQAWQQAIQAKNEDVREYAWQYGLPALAQRCPKGIAKEAAAILITWQQAIQHKDSDVRESAWEYGFPALAQYCPKAVAKEATTILQAWQQAIQAANEDVRQSAWQYGLPALAQYCPALVEKEAAAILNAWQQAIQHKDSDVRQYAWKYGLPALAQYCPALVEKEAAAILTAWQQAIHHKDSDVRQYAWKYGLPALAQYCPALVEKEAAAILTAWQQAIQHQDSWVRAYTWEYGFPALAQYCPKIVAKEAAAILTAWQQAIQHQDSWVRAYTWEYGLPALAQYCPNVVAKEAATILQAWQQAMQDQGSWVRAYTWEYGLPALAQHCPKGIAKEAATILQAWQQAIQDQDEYVRQAACKYGLPALAQYCPKLVAKEVAAILQAWQQAIQDQDSWLVRLSAWVYGFPALAQHCAKGIAKEAAAILNTWQQAIQDQDRCVRQSAWAYSLPALAQYCPKAVQKETAAILTAWQQAIQDQDSSVRQYAWAYGLPALAQHCPKAVQKEAAAILTAWQQAILDKHRNVQQSAWQYGFPALAQHCPGPTILTTWQQAIQDQDRYVRESAWEYGLPALAQHCHKGIAKAAATILIAWQQAIQHKDSDVRESAWEYGFPALAQHCPKGIAKAAAAILTAWQQAIQDYCVRRVAWNHFGKAIHTSLGWHAFIDAMVKQPMPPPIKIVKQVAANGIMGFLGGTTTKTTYQSAPLPTIKILAQAIRYYIPLVYHTAVQQKTLPKYPALLKALKTQARKEGYPIEHYTNHPLPPAKPCHPAINPNQLQKEALNAQKARCCDTVLHVAASQGDISQLIQLGKAGKISINDANNLDQRTPLLCALAHQEWEAARYCIAQGAWIDVADATNGIATKALDYIYPAQDLHLFQEMLATRCCFPSEKIIDTFHFLESRLKNTQGYWTAPGKLTYRNIMTKTIAQLLGATPSALTDTIQRNGSQYRGNTRNLLVKHQERGHVQQFTQGMSTGEFLMIRIYVLFELWYRVKSIGKNAQRLPSHPTQNRRYNPAEALKSLQQELATQLTTYWDYQITLRLSSLENDSALKKTPKGWEGLYYHWAQAMLYRFSQQPNLQEINIATGYQHPQANQIHTLYISLRKTANYYTLRLDNRWLNTVPHPKKHYHPHNAQQHIQPALIAYFPAKDLDKYADWLKQYLGKALFHYWAYHRPTQVMQHLYQPRNAPKEGHLPKSITHWPHRPQQNNADNCFMRSHNVGCAIRLGASLYQWFREEEAISSIINVRQKFHVPLQPNLAPLLPQEDDDDHKSNFLPHKGGNNAPEQKYNPPTTPHKKTKKSLKATSQSQPSLQQPISHTQLMQHLAHALKVDYSQVYSGIAVEQALIRKAGITRIQRGAGFCRIAQTQATRFKLRLNRQELNQFQTYYQTQHPHLIHHIERQGTTWAIIILNTHVLFHEVAPTLLKN